MKITRAILLALLMGTVLAWTFPQGREGLRQAVTNLGAFLQLTGPPVAASSGRVSEHDLEELNGMTPQDQVMRLLEKAINHYGGASEEIEKRLDDWRGHIQSTPDLERLTNLAYFSNDLRIRALALELWLVRDGIAKNTDAVDAFIRDGGLNDGRQYYRLSMLGVLGNRGVEAQKALSTLTTFIHDPNGDMRAAAINGLGLLGTEGTIQPLLEVMRWDSSFDLRERAACNLADSGMLSREQRQKAVPELIRFGQDETLDATTKKWVFQALREITQQSQPDDGAAWARWYASRPIR